MNDIAKRLKALSVTYYTLGALCIPASFIAPAAILTGVMNGTDIPPPPAAHILLIVVAVVSLLCSLVMSGCLLYAGHALARYKARTFIFVVAVMLCLSVPIGTIIGLFTLGVLGKHEAKELFATNTRLRNTERDASLTPSRIVS